jgi:16S rRNA (cytosine1402-N4)-methyltransferase
VLAALAAERAPDALAGWVVDATLGAGGHARAVLETFPGVRLFGVDQDPEALEEARAALAPFGERARILHGRISELEERMDEAGVRDPVGMLFDLGASSLQLDRPERGFSFQVDGPLDMRMDPRRERTAADIVNRWDEADLADLFYYEGGEHRSRRVARAVVESRRRAPFQRTMPLADLIAHVVGRHGERIHPATRCFQALRRAVNEEGEELYRGLQIAEGTLADGGRLVAISFHSGEDRMVKRFLGEGAREGRWRLATKKPARPEPSELRANPRSRSARLRAGVRTREPARRADIARLGGRG